MIGNNLARDIKGAKDLGIETIFLDWSPRYPKLPSCEAETPGYTIHEPLEAFPIVRALQQKKAQVVV